MPWSHVLHMSTSGKLEAMQSNSYVVGRIILGPTSHHLMCSGPSNADPQQGTKPVGCLWLNWEYFCAGSLTINTGHCNWDYPSRLFPHCSRLQPLDWNSSGGYSVGCIQWRVSWRVQGWGSSRWSVDKNPCQSCLCCFCKQAVLHFTKSLMRQAESWHPTGFGWIYK